MWTRILLLPWWARALVAVGIDIVLNTPDWLSHADSRESLLSTVVSMAIFGLVVAASTSISHQTYKLALADLEPAQRAAALNASFGGPVPADAVIRDAAIQVNRRRLRIANSWRLYWPLLLGLSIVSIARNQASNSAVGVPASDWFDLALLVACTVTSWHVSLRVKDRLPVLGEAICA